MKWGLLIIHDRGAHYQQSGRMILQEWENRTAEAQHIEN